MNTLVIINIIVTDQKSEQRINDKPLRLFVDDKLTVAYPAVFTCCPSRLVFEFLHLNLHLHLPIIVLAKRFDKFIASYGVMSIVTVCCRTAMLS